MSKYTIVGNGIAALMAAKAIAEHDYGSPITIIAPRSMKTFSKPALRYLLEGKLRMQQIQRLPDDFYVQNNFHFINDMVSRVNPITKTLMLSSNKTEKYAKLLLAYGAEGVAPGSEGLDRENVLSGYSFKDILTMQRLIPKVSRAVVVGAGATGLAMADALSANGIHVTVVEKTNAILNNRIPLEHMNLILGEYRKRGVLFILNDEVKHCGGSGSQATYVETEKGGRFETQLVVFCCGMRTDVSLVAKTKIRRHNGIIVERDMSSTVENVWSAGTSAEFDDKVYNRYERYSEWQDCATMGRVAGLNMVGKKALFRPGIPLFSAELAGQHFHMLGEQQVVDRRENGSVVERLDRGAGSFARLVFRDRILVGGSWYGASLNPFILRKIIESESSLEQVGEHLLDPSFPWEHVLRLG
ncbi:MAG: NAD(P)/FAD-dependent oxidoreductase [Nanoarchaeota archaeon]